jgi:hypothetical protein
MTTPNDTPTPAMTDEQVAAVMAAVLETLQPKMEKSITGAIGRVIRQSEQRFASLEARLAAPELDDSESGEPSKPAAPAATPAPASSGESSAQIKALQEQFAAREQQMEKQIADIKKAAEDRFTAMQQDAEKRTAEAVQQAERMKLASKLGDRVANPQHFLTLAEQSGDIQYKDGKYVRAVLNMYNEQEFVPVDKAGANGDYLDELLSSDYSYMAKARPGTGLGSTGGRAAQQQQAQSKFFGEKTADPQELATVVAEKGMGALVADLLASAES